MSDNINTNGSPATVCEKEIVYKECARNFAKSVGKVAYDGCPEFLQRDDDPNDEDALLCACCDCHRSFHHQQIVYKPIPQTEAQAQTPTPTPTQTPTPAPTPTPTPTPTQTPTPAPTQTPTPTQAQTPNVTTSVAAGSSDQFRSMMMMPKRKKRVTYSLEMRTKLVRFADSIGWKPRKENHEEIERFCSEIKMTRNMFIIWLSNNRRRAMQNAQAPQN